MKKHSTVALFVFVSFMICLSKQRHFETSMKFTSFARDKGWIFLDKMSFAPGVVKFTIETKVTGIPYGGSG
jgi:hypothetical protein